MISYNFADLWYSIFTLTSDIWFNICFDLIWRNLARFVWVILYFRWYLIFNICSDIWFNIGFDPIWRNLEKFVWVILYFLWYSIFNIYSDIWFNICFDPIWRNLERFVWVIGGCGVIALKVWAHPICCIVMRRINVKSE